MFAKISWLCVFLAVGLFVWGGFCLIWSGDDRQHGDTLIVENRDQNLGEQMVGIHTVELRLRNTSSLPYKFLGMTGA